MSLLSLLAALCAIGLLWPWNKPPLGRGLPPVLHLGYYECPRCGSLEGGIYGKGSPKWFQSSEARWCVHEWRKVSRAAFCAAAHERHGYDWSREGPSWWCGATGCAPHGALLGDRAAVEPAGTVAPARPRGESG